MNAAQANNTSAFASGNEREWAQWQVSYDNARWANIGGATGASYQPGAITRKTFYRRVSTHIVSYWWRWDSRENWYTSEVVTITPESAIPSPTRPSFATCNSGAVTVAISPVASAPSYNWYAAGANWDINGNGRSLDNSGSTSVQITPPAGIVPGTYLVYVSANSTCGNSSPSAAISIVVTNTPLPAPTAAYFTPSINSSDCYPSYDLVTAPINGTIQYQATLSNGMSAVGYSDPTNGDIRFYIGLPGPQYGITATITALGACGPSPSFTTDPSYLSGPINGPYCDPTVLQVKTVAYPNPATSQLTIEGINKELEVILYDQKGLPCMTVTLHKQDARKSINVQDLPAGIYYLRALADGKVAFSKQLVIQH